MRRLPLTARATSKKFFFFPLHFVSGPMVRSPTSISRLSPARNWLSKCTYPADEI